MVSTPSRTRSRACSTTTTCGCRLGAEGCEWARANHTPERFLEAFDSSHGLARRMTGTLRVAFLLERFPVVSETFLLTEMRGLQGAGHVVDVVSTTARAGASPCTTRSRTQGCSAERSTSTPH